ncbi:YbeF family protein [Bacillus haikouensis]|nr:YbeF family protein [Bacillus haikouensis]
MNVFFILLILFPVISVILGIAGYAIFKNIIAAPAVVFFASMIALFLVFNETFLIWVFVYTILALVSGVFVKAFNKKVN